MKDEEWTTTNATMLADGDKLEVSWTASPKECLVCNETQTGRFKLRSVGEGAPEGPCGVPYLQ
jgi:hypothetical protein